MIAIVNTGGANLASIQNAFDRLGESTILTCDPATITTSSHVLLPGVGAAEDSMRRLEKSGLIEAIRTLTQPVLGICLGMQLLFEKSDEGNASCLGVLPGTVRKMKPHREEQITIPHMGWNKISVKNPIDPLLFDLPLEAYVYFVHSYQAPMGKWVSATTKHGNEIPAVVVKDNFRGTQFHPERSGPPGAQILRNFVKL